MSTTTTVATDLAAALRELWDVYQTTEPPIDQYKWDAVVADVEARVWRALARFDANQEAGK